MIASSSHWDRQITIIEGPKSCVLVLVYNNFVSLSFCWEIDFLTSSFAKLFSNLFDNWPVNLKIFLCLDRVKKAPEIKAKLLFFSHKQTIKRERNEV